MNITGLHYRIKNKVLSFVFCFLDFRLYYETNFCFNCIVPCLANPLQGGFLETIKNNYARKNHLIVQFLSEQLNKCIQTFELPNNLTLMKCNFTSSKTQMN